MPLAVFAWLCWVLWLVLGGYAGYRCGGPNGWWLGGANVLLALLLFILIWKSFGFIVSG